MEREREQSFGERERAKFWRERAKFKGWEREQSLRDERESKVLGVREREQSFRERDREREREQSCRGEREGVLILCNYFTIFCGTKKYMKIHFKNFKFFYFQSLNG